VKVKRWKKDLPYEWIAKLNMSNYAYINKIDFEMKTVKEDKESDYIMTGSQQRWYNGVKCNLPSARHSII
jgi:hypothetical protein